MTEFIWPVRVYYEDTDSGGVVYYANYLKFMERARTEWLRSHGFEQDRLIAQDGIIFAVRHVDADFLRPARFNDALEVSASIANHGKVSMNFAQEVRLAESGQVLCRGEVKVACLHAERFRPHSIPKKILVALTE
ncbi:Tol-Pal system-associated acyl-CoA thioesterase [hydrothermal vent metagenome]|uniref:Tol-Pal system-associated acyl-CoA thioesterase n=1 Tax=hydrothermal vent metagenome TaxID=652676 RepID=A0A3B1BNZ3_9ZZZZ